MFAFLYFILLIIDLHKEGRVMCVVVLLVRSCSHRNNQMYVLDHLGQ
jgi:hypothetical protein